VGKMKDRMAWSERLFKKGYVTGQQLGADRALLRKTEAESERARGGTQRSVARPESKD
jgi:hypothetical protein